MILIMSFYVSSFLFLLIFIQHHCLHLFIYLLLFFFLKSPVLAAAPDNCLLYNYSHNIFGFSVILNNTNTIMLSYILYARILYIHLLISLFLSSRGCSVFLFFTDLRSYFYLFILFFSSNFLSSLQLQTTHILTRSTLLILTISIINFHIFANSKNLSKLFSVNLFSS